MSLLEVPEDDVALDVDPDGEPMWLDFFGRKGSGKSNLARVYFKSWPYDALLIDTTGDGDPDGSFTTPWPGGRTWPEPENPEKPFTHYRVKPERTNPLFAEVIDDAILAIHEKPGPGLLWIDELREVAKVNQIRPGMMTVLNESRHGEVFVLGCGPRPVTIDPLMLTQADWVFVFELANVYDVRRVAQTCGVTEDALKACLKSTEKYGFVRLRADRPGHIDVYPPVPS